LDLYQSFTKIFLMIQIFIPIFITIFIKISIFAQFRFWPISIFSQFRFLPNLDFWPISRFRFLNSARSSSCEFALDRRVAIWLGRSRCASRIFGRILLENRQFHTFCFLSIWRNTGWSWEQYRFDDFPRFLPVGTLKGRISLVILVPRRN